MSYQVEAKEQQFDRSYAHPNHSVSLPGPDLRPNPVRRRFGHEGERQELSRYSSFSVFLYDSTYHPVFVDQKNTAMEMILHGQRIATNADLRLMPTPEQWDLVATLKGRHADKANNRLTADLAS
jgi:hypothetical protein